MTQEAMQADFDAWYPPPGIPISREAAWAAYQQGQRDLIATLSEPVAWVRRHPDGGLTDRFIENDAIEPVRKQSGAWVPLVRQPEGKTK